MKKKSKFLTFLLSFIPGLSHFYIGDFERGAIYLFITGGLFASAIVLESMFYSGFGVPMAFGGIAIVWLIALLDAFSSLNSREANNHNNGETMDNKVENKVENKKIIALALSIIPGAGHMYLNYQKRGLIFMGGFFFTIFFMGWLNLSFLVFILPLIWFYSFFDAYHILNGSNIEDIDLEGFLPKIKQKYIGLGLIIIGIIVILQNMIYPIISTYIDYQFVRYLQTIIVALIFIIGGIRLVRGKKEIQNTEDIIIKTEEIIIEEGDKDE